MLHVARGWLPDAPTVAVQTENGDSDGTVLAHFAILGHDPSISKGMEAHGRLTLLHAQTNNTIIRDVQITRVEYWLAKKRDGNYEEPLTIFSGNMGGKVYNLAMDLHTWSNELTMGPRFRTLLIDGTSNPLAFYQPNVEAMDAGPQSEITGAKNVSFYAFKYEYDHKLLHIENSDNINIFGGSGNYSLRNEGQSIVTVSATPNYLLVNLERKPYKEKRDSRYDWITDSDVSYPASVVNVGMFGKGATTSYGELLGAAGGASLN